MRCVLSLLLLIAAASCSNDDDAEAVGKPDPGPTVTVQPAADKPKVKPDASAITDMLKQGFGADAMRAVRVSVEDDGTDARVTLRGEVPSENLKQAVINEVAARVERLRFQDFDLQVSGIIPLRRVVELEISPDKETIFTRDLRFAAGFEPSPWGGRRPLGVWELAPGRRLNRLSAMALPPVETLAFSPDGKFLATGHMFDAITLWTLPLCHERTELAASKGPTSANDIVALAFAPDGSALVSVYRDNGQVWWWDLGPSRKARLIATLEPRQTYTLAFSPDGKTLATAAGSDDAITLWDAATASKRSALAGPRMHVEAIAWSPDGKSLAAARSFDPAGVTLFDVATGKANTLTLPESGTIAGLAFSPDGRTLAAQQQGTGVVLWELPAGREWARLDKLKTGGGRGLAFSRDGHTLAVAYQQSDPRAADPSGIYLWDVSSRPGAVRAAAVPEPAAESVTPRDDFLAEQISHSLKRFLGSQRAANVEVDVLPDGAIRLRGTVPHRELKDAIEHAVINNFPAGPLKGPAPPEKPKVINELEVRGQ